MPTSRFGGVLGSYLKFQVHVGAARSSGRGAEAPREARGGGMEARVGGRHIIRLTLTSGGRRSRAK